MSTTVASPRYQDDRVSRAVRLAIACGSGLVLAAPAVALAEEQAGGLQEIVVTASRVGAESLQDVPMAISALSPDDLASKGISDMGDFLRTVPGVVLNAENAGVNRVTMRGLVSRDINITDLQDRSMVAIYLDEIPVGLNMSNPDLRVLDMERIEVIRGPQGTLYGAGSMAGTIRYITRKPDASQFFGTADTFGSSTERGGTNWGLKGSVNLPLATDKLALRLGGYREENDGFVDRADSNGVTVEKDANSQVTTQANAALRWTPTDALTVDLSFIYQKFQSDGSNGVFREFDNRAFSGVPTGFDDDLKIYNLTLSYDAGPVDIISSTSYVDREFTISSSFDFISLYLFGVQVAPSYENSDIRNFTQEIRVVSKPGPFQWQVGAYYGDDKRHYIQHSFIEGLDEIIGLPSQDLYAPYPDEVYYGDIPLEDKQWALFGEATYQFNDRLSLTAGLRYFDFKGPADYFQGGIAGVDADLQPVAHQATEKANGLNPKLLVSYQASDDVMLFAEAAKGFRYGGVNYPVPISFCGEDLAQDGLTSAPLTFGPDKVWSYSIGEKGAFLDRRITLNATAFYIKWSDAQTVHPLNCGYPFTENGGDITSRGFEFETHFRVTDGLTLGLNATYTNAESDGGIPTIGARDGDKVPFFPEWMAAVSADYVWAIGTGELRLAADFSYRDDMGTEFNPEDPNYRKIPSSSVVNASVNYRMGQWQVGLFGTNLSDSEQISYVGAPTLPTQPGDQLFLGRPRTFGLRVQVDF